MRLGGKHMSRVPLCLLVLVLALSAPPPVTADEAVLEVPLCQLLGDPGAYHHKLIRVSGRVSRGFEDFSISEKSCPSATLVWLEYGGPEPAQVTYCCVTDGPKRPNGKDPLWVEGIETSIVRNATSSDSTA
jgi:hypothetical protein